MVQAREHVAGELQAVPLGLGRLWLTRHRDGDLALQQLVAPAPRDDRCGPGQLVTEVVAPAEHRLRGGDVRQGRLPSWGLRWRNRTADQQ
jgi:hypothetical protein